MCPHGESLYSSAVTWNRVTSISATLTASSENNKRSIGVAGSNVMKP